MSHYWTVFISICTIFVIANICSNSALSYETEETTSKGCSASIMVCLQDLSSEHKHRKSNNQNNTPFRKTMRKSFKHRRHSNKSRKKMYKGILRKRSDRAKRNQDIFMNWSLIPKIPNIPNIPNIPSIPKIPKIPKINKIQTIDIEDSFGPNQYKINSDENHTSWSYSDGENAINVNYGTPNSEKKRRNQDNEKRKEKYKRSNLKRKSLNKIKKVFLNNIE